jgi:hypothetical protein
MRVAGRCLCGVVRCAGDSDPRFAVKCYCTEVAEVMEMK